MALGLTIFLTSAVMMLGSLALISERQFYYRRTLGQAYRSAIIGAVLVAFSWLSFLVTLVLGAKSVDPLSGWVPLIGSCVWLFGAVAGALGLRLRRGDPDRTNIASCVALWAALAIDPYVSDVVPTVALVTISLCIITGTVVVRLLRHRQKRAAL